MSEVVISAAGCNIELVQTTCGVTLTQETANQVEINADSSATIVSVPSAQIEINQTANTVEINQTATAVVIIGIGSNGTDGADGLNEGLIAKISDFTLTAADDYTTYSNEGASALITATLATPSAALKNGFVNLTEHGFKIKAPTGKKIKYGSVETATGGHLTTTEIAAYLEVLGVNNDVYIVRGPVGDWRVDA